MYYPGHDRHDICYCPNAQLPRHSLCNPDRCRNALRRQLGQCLFFIGQRTGIGTRYNCVVWVAAGIYYGDTLSEDAFTMMLDVNVYGGFAGTESADFNLSLRDFEANETILDGGSIRRVLYLSGYMIWDGFTIRNGYTSGNGGGIYNSGDAILNHCNVINNHADGNGGGIYYLNRNVILNHCNVINNHADGNGGGIYNSLVNHNDSSSIVNCIITKNTTSNDGAGIYMKGPTYVSNCLIANNTIVRNHAERRGGIQANIVYNNAEMIKNNIVWSNSSGFSSNVLPISYSAIEGGYDGVNNITLDISNQFLFVNPSLTTGAEDATENVDWHLVEGAVCINRGTNTAIIDSVDLDGNPRIQCDTVDMGCYEYHCSNTGIVHHNHDTAISLQLYPNPTSALSMYN